MSGEIVQRKIDPTLKTWLDNQLLNPPVLPFVDPKNPVKMLLLTALVCENTHEIGQDNSGPMVELFQKTIGRAEREPWCMAFIQSCVAYVETFNFKTSLYASEHCLTVFNNSKTLQQKDPIAGDLVIYQYGETTKGHVELVMGVSSKTLDTIGGNTGPGKEIEREGDGVYLKKRPRGGMGTMKELGFLRVFTHD